MVTNSSDFTLGAASGQPSRRFSVLMEPPRPRPVPGSPGQEIAPADEMALDEAAPDEIAPPSLGQVKKS